MTLERQIAQGRSELRLCVPYSEKWFRVNAAIAEKVRKWRETNDLRSVR